MINIDVKLNLNFPKLNLENELKEIADRIIIPDIQSRMVKGVDIDNKAYPPLAQSTIRAKRKRGLRQEILFAEGKLFRSFFAVKKSGFGVKITSRSDRKEIGEKLQFEGVKSRTFGRRHFKFFGISDKAENTAMTFMRNRIKNRIARGK
ncbi:unnamed protein product [marine sediment metagenome]|uniref:Phage virion morphogenesis protein n=1 Tax=marine sediment metagenome TaxID=412755 RepID=X0SKF0_9ZZZZ